MKNLWLFILFFPIVLFAQKKTEASRPKVGVVLSGGGAKGYAHIGVLKMIEKAGIKIDYIGGTSMGAIVGGLYAAGYTPEQLETIVKSMDLSSLIINQKSRSDIPFFDKNHSEKYILELPFDNFKVGIPYALSTGQGPMEALTFLLRHVHNIDDFNKLPTPFVCVATNLESGNSHVFHDGYLPQVIMASGAFPTLLDPVQIGDSLYVDGGVINNYPVKQVKDLGADILIGVDIQDGLATKDQIKSAADILSQIIGYNMVKNSDEQKKLLDLNIQPDIKGFTVTSFDAFNEIENRGLVAAEKMMPQLEEIAKLQGYPSIVRKPVEMDEETVLIKNVDITGLKLYNRKYIKGKLGIKTPQLVSYDQIREGVKALYSSGNFININYRIQKNDEGDNTLIFDIRENPTRQFIKFGLHYDDIYKTGLLVNYTRKHLLFKNSVFSFDFVFGDFARYNLNYFIDNGSYPSFGFNSSFSQFNKEIKVKNLADFPLTDIADINYNFDWIYNQIYTQYTLFEKYALGIGIEHQYVDINTNNISNPEFSSIDKSYYIDAYTYLQIDNRDNSNFASKGVNFKAGLKYFFDSNTENFENLYVFNADFETNLKLNKKVSFKLFGTFGTFLNDNVPNSQKFIIGGYVKQPFLNYTQMYGLPFGYQFGDNIIKVGSGIQYRILKNHYLSAMFNMANVENNFKQLKYLDYKYLGFGVTYGYDSPFGPINFYWTYSPQTGKGLFNVNLGFWF